MTERIILEIYLLVIISQFAHGCDWQLQTRYSTVCTTGNYMGYSTKDECTTYCSNNGYYYFMYLTIRTNVRVTILAQTSRTTRIIIFIGGNAFNRHRTQRIRHHIRRIRRHIQRTRHPIQRIRLHTQRIQPLDLHQDLHQNLQQNQRIQRPIRRIRHHIPRIQPLGQHQDLHQNPHRNQPIRRHIPQIQRLIRRMQPLDQHQNLQRNRHQNPHQDLH
eukprot:1045371_1